MPRWRARVRAFSTLGTLNSGVRASARDIGPQHRYRGFGGRGAGVAPGNVGQQLSVLAAGTALTKPHHQPGLADALATTTRVGQRWGLQLGAATSATST